MRIPYKYAVALTAALGLFMAVLDNTIVNVGLIPMQKAFNTDLNAVQWVITAYFLAQAAVIPAAGYLSSRLGVKQVFIACLALFTLGSLLCGLSDIFQDSSGHPYIGLLIFFRVVQGIGGGALFPLATAIAFSAFPPAERASSSAVIGLPVLMAPSFGPTIGGLLIDSIGWQWIFFINVPVGILAIFLMVRIYKPENEQKDPNKAGAFDYVGLTLSMLGIVALVYGFNMVSQRDPGTVTATNPGSIYGWGYWEVWAWVVSGVVLLIAFLVYELRSKDPVVDLRLYKERDFTTASIMTWAMRAFVFGSFFLLPVFLQNIRNPHLSATVAGLATMPMGLASGVAVVLTGRKLYAALGPRYLVLLGVIFMAASNFLLLGLDNNTDGWSLIPAMILRGIGFGMSGIPLQTVALEKLKGYELPRASSLYNASAQIFSSIGIAVLTTLFVQQTTAHQPSQAAIQALAQSTAQQMAPAYLASHPGLTAAALQTTPDFTQKVQAAVAAQVTSQAGIPAMTDVFLVVTVAMIALIFLSFILPDKQSRKSVGMEEGAESEQNEPMLVE
jgi:EmrB/QacA subfamily drug resistance transporter